LQPGAELERKPIFAPISQPLIPTYPSWQLALKLRLLLEYCLFKLFHLTVIALELNTAFSFLRIEGRIERT